MTPQLQCLQSFQEEKEDEFQAPCAASKAWSLGRLVAWSLGCSFPLQVDEDSQEAETVATGEWVDPEPRQGVFHASP